MAAPIVVTGLPRSGTTFVATVLSRPDGVHNIGEPFQHRVGIDHHYPYYRTTNRRGETYDRVLADVLAYRKLATYRIRKLEPTLKGVLRRFLGSSGTIAYAQAWLSDRVLGGDARLLLKEPHGPMLTLPAVRDLGCKVLLLVRHPGGQVSSKMSLGWTARRDRPESLLDQPRLVEDHLDWLPEVLETTERSTVEDLGLMWRALNQVALDQVEALGDSPDVEVVTHETVSLQPVETFRKLYDWADLPWSDDVEATVRELTSPDNPTERTEATAHQHGHRRDSRALVEAWKERLDPDEVRALRKVTEPVAGRFYDDASWDVGD